MEEILSRKTLIMKTIPIAFAFDKKIEMPAGVAIFSLLSHADEDTFYDIFILHSDRLDFSDSKIKELAIRFPHCRITFRAVKDEFVGAFEIRGITETCYYRLLIPELIPEYDKVLYSDVDVIFREDLSKYYDIPLGDCYFGSVNAVPVMNDDYLSYIKTRGISPKDGYFYSGNLIINSRKIREDGKLAEFRSHRNQQYKFQDMDIINLTCRGSILPLPPAFCVTVNYFDAIVNQWDRMRTFYSDTEMEYALENGLIHYNGAKPWNTVTMNMDIWWHHYRQSPFFDQRFSTDFWEGQAFRLSRMPLLERMKLVVRYFIERTRR